MSTTTVSIGRLFFDDHMKHGGIPIAVVRETARMVTIEVDPDSMGWYDLLTDARYHASFVGVRRDPGDAALAKAAARVLKKMLDAEAAVNYRYDPPVADGTKAKAPDAIAKHFSVLG